MKGGASGAFEEFAGAREAGAEKIVDNAKKKGGFAMLTWHHFKVKLPYYKKAAAGKFDLAEAKREFKRTYAMISTKMSQVEFQTEMGRLEVLGELILREEAKSKKTNESQVMSYSEFLSEKKVNSAYLTKDAAEMKSEIRKHAKKSDDDASAYTSHSKGGWKADYSKSGKRYKTRPSKYTLAFRKKFGK
jgi:hypothetical protein